MSRPLDTAPAPTHPAAAAPLVVPPGGAVVRMYCTGLGDCFLVALRGKFRKTHYVLIDCGVWKGSPGAPAWMTQIMQHIKDTVGEQGLDVVVVTHAHWDHACGFAQAQAIFESIPVKDVWLPWTEDGQDPLARQLVRERRLATAAVFAAVERLRAAAEQAGDDKSRDQILAKAEAIDGLLTFMGHAPADIVAATAPAAAARAPSDTTPPAAERLAPGSLAADPTTDDLLSVVKQRVAQPRFLRPSTTALHLPDVPDTSIYALGPPTDVKFLGKDDPSSDPAKSEAYAALGAAEPTLMNEAGAIFAAAHREPNSEAWRRQQEQLLPFDKYHRIQADTAFSHAEHGPFFRQHYGRPKDAWRRIDTAWLETVEQLALNLDSHVNNTSLVLAFELGTGERAPVLLFTGDAQVGNWLSWHTLGDGNFARSLLERTVLYKVGHHASHNATLKGQGLELMTRRTQLVAMIPVDQREASQPKGQNQQGWAMPCNKLLIELQARTEGRVMRADTGVELLTQGPPAGWSKKKWDQFRRDTVVEMAAVPGQAQPRPLFVQYTVRS